MVTFILLRLIYTSLFTDMVAHKKKIQIVSHKFLLDDRQTPSSRKGK